MELLLTAIIQLKAPQPSQLILSPTPAVQTQSYDPPAGTGSGPVRRKGGGTRFK